MLYYCIKSYARVPESPAQGEAMAVKGVLGVVAISAAACSLDARLLLSRFFAPAGSPEVSKAKAAATAKVVLLQPHIARRCQARALRHASLDPSLASLASSVIRPRALSLRL